MGIDREPLERRAFLLKDSIFVIDDFAPSTLDHREIESKAARLLRAQGNLAGRGRLKSDLTERPAFAPRGIIIGTGEQHPPGQSLLARTFVIELDRDEVDIDHLTQAQQNSHRLSHAMAGYIAWLTPQMAGLSELLRETFRRTRAAATAGTEHLRIPEGVSHLWVGLHAGLNYAEEIGAVSLTDAAEIRDRCWKAFLKVAHEQAKIVDQEQPTRRFLDVLFTIIAQGRAVLLAKSESGIDAKPGVEFLGWRDAEFLYLIPEATYLAVARFCRETGEHFFTRRERLQQDLAKERISECDPERFTRTARIAGRIKRVLKTQYPSG